MAINWTHDDKVRMIEKAIEQYSEPLSVKQYTVHYKFNGLTYSTKFWKKANAEDFANEVENYGVEINEIVCREVWL